MPLEAQSAAARRRWPPPRQSPQHGPGSYWRLRNQMPPRRSRHQVITGLRSYIGADVQVLCHDGDIERRRDRRYSSKHVEENYEINPTRSTHQLNRRRAKAEKTPSHWWRRKSRSELVKRPHAFLPQSRMDLQDQAGLLCDLTLSIIIVFPADRAFILPATRAPKRSASISRSSAMRSRACPITPLPVRSANFRYHDASLRRSSVVGRWA